MEGILNVSDRLSHSQRHWIKPFPSPSSFPVADSSFHHKQIRIRGEALRPWTVEAQYTYVKMLEKNQRRCVFITSSSSQWWGRSLHPRDKWVPDLMTYSVEQMEFSVCQSHVLSAQGRMLPATQISWKLHSGTVWTSRDYEANDTALGGRVRYQYFPQRTNGFLEWSAPTPNSSKKHHTCPGSAQLHPKPHGGLGRGGQGTSQEQMTATLPKRVQKRARSHFCPWP